MGTGEIAEGFIFVTQRTSEVSRTQQQYVINFISFVFLHVDIGLQNACSILNNNLHKHAKVTITQAIQTTGKHYILLWASIQ